MKNNYKNANAAYRYYAAQNVKVQVLKVKFQNLGENRAEAHFNLEPKSGSYVPIITETNVGALPWES